MQIGLTVEEVEKQLQEKSAISNNEWDDKNKSWEDEWKSENQDEENIPFHKHPRFQQLAKENREFKQKLADIEKNKANEIKEARQERKIDPDMPFDEAIKLIKQDAVQEALEALKAEQNKDKEQNSYYENLLSEWFDYLRDSGHKISSKDEDTISELALKYKIKIEQPEDLEKAFEIFDLTRKTAGTWKSKEDSTIITDRKSNDKWSWINYSTTSWSDIWNKIWAKLWLKGNDF